MGTTDTAAVQRLERVGILRLRELEALGHSRADIARLAERGAIERVGRGLYALPNRDVPANHALAVAAKRVPRGVVCLLSALQFHELTTQLPREVWLAIGEKDWRPVDDGLHVRIVRFSLPALSEGVDTHVIDGVDVRVFGVAKTIADCFKYRNKIGLDVALEALREGLRQRRCSADELWRYARIDRVANVMRPYIEALA